MSATLYDYVRGLTEEVPLGYELRGLRVYRYLVRLGASQMIDACFPNLKKELGEEAWRTLIDDFVRQSKWTSNFYGDMEDEFLTYLARTIAKSN